MVISGKPGLLAAAGYSGLGFDSGTDATGHNGGMAPDCGSVAGSTPLSESRAGWPTAAVVTETGGDHRTRDVAHQRRHALSLARVQRAQR